MEVQFLRIHSGFVIAKPASLFLRIRSSQASLKVFIARRLEVVLSPLQRFIAVFCVFIVVLSTEGLGLSFLPKVF